MSLSFFLEDLLDSFLAVEFPELPPLLDAFEFEAVLVEVEFLSEEFLFFPEFLSEELLETLDDPFDVLLVLLEFFEEPPAVLADEFDPPDES